MEASDAAQALIEIERRIFEVAPKEAAALLGPLVEDVVPGAVRAQALALRALREANEGSGEGLAAARRSIESAAVIEAAGDLAAARITHARGYVAFRQGARGPALSELNRAVDLYGDHPAKAQVLDTLGMLFRDLYGDADRARAYFIRSYAFKKKDAGQAGFDWIGLAITCGNLGQLELAAERFEEAERWFREDLELVSTHGRPAFGEAIARTLLAESLFRQGAALADEAREHVDASIEIAPKGSRPHVIALVLRARMAVAAGDDRRAREAAHAAREIAEARGYSDELGSILLVEGLQQAKRAEHATDDAALAAIQCFEDARRAFRGLSLPEKTIETALAQADLHRTLGNTGESLRLLLEVALPDAERHLFGQLQPLARIEARIASLDAWQALRLKQRRTLGGVAEEDWGGRLHGDRRRVSVWTCDIRGFTEYCDKTDPKAVVETLNRLFAWVGQPIIDAGGVIDKYVGDNILAYFPTAEQAAGLALGALRKVGDLNAQRRHLDEPELAIGIGIATGDVIVGNIGFSRKLEHTIVGTAVNRACRLVNEAKGGEIVADEETKQSLSGAFRFDELPPLSLKGLGKARAFRLMGRVEPSFSPPHRG